MTDRESKIFLPLFASPFKKSYQPVIPNFPEIKFRRIAENKMIRPVK